MRVMTLKKILIDFIILCSIVPLDRGFLNLKYLEESGDDGGAGGGSGDANNDAGGEGGDGEGGEAGAGGTPRNDGGDAGSGEEGSEEEGVTVPESYEPFALPEGMEYDQGLHDTITPVFQKHKITQEAFNEIGESFAKLAVERDKEADKAFQDTVKSWENEVKADKELGGDNLANTSALSALALKQYGDESFMELLDTYGIGNHPGVVRFLTKVGKTLKEDSPIGGAGGEGQKKSTAEILYPDAKN